ncbi:LEAF RUST 10 DISEASE-RESISTANCE LOCUS RECEPTOR-LIKE PROTEIN KINASE-like 2.1 [Prosopis cineraria]|uniref:LEAF RUST 10 DISEASE-RESISTANCE LOCUS RECEPTOR-LIKE PROTEIN KINASE-like 2.1 n=1 Tax=Prosopis cineraria TaxID=364024 RepID=UPI0024106721|nr:LEAF RUST 10 DISEASE-RESISTANCE LOCUS RECEPTOR-LIKE PROTEIN KINASE-like 2.1 [Prosopis cineraria]
MLFSYTFRNLFFFCYLLLSSTTVPQYQSRREDDGYVNCHYTYNCGNFDIPYPFWGENRPGYCGRDGFKVKCLPSNLPSIQIGSQNFTLTGINQDRWIVKMVRTDIPSYDNCSFHFTNTSLDPSLFSFDTSVVNMTLFYDCDPGISIGQNNITCMDDSKKQAFFVMNQDHQSGRLFTEISQHCGIQLVAITMGVTVDPFGGIESLRAALDMGFDVQYLANWSYCSLCMQSGGICGSVRDNGSLFSCHCRDGSYDFVCPNLASMASLSVPSICRHFSFSALCISVFCSCHAFFIRCIVSHIIDNFYALRFVW